MANPIFDMMYGGMPNQQPSFSMPSLINNYVNVLQRANQLAQSLPQNFNPQMIAQQMVANGQVSQQQLQQAMQIANQLTGRR